MSLRQRFASSVDIQLGDVMIFIDVRPRLSCERTAIVLIDDLDFFFYVPHKYLHTVEEGV